MQHPGVEVHLRPAHAVGLANARSVAVDKADEHPVAERLAVTLAHRLDKTLCFGGPEIPAILCFRLLARGAAPWHWLNSYGFRDLWADTIGRMGN